MSSSTKVPPKPSKPLKPLDVSGLKVPVWAGSNSTNTCTIDGFLAILLCGKWKSYQYAWYILGEDAFTVACLAFINGTEDVKTKKEKFISALFTHNENGSYDLFGDEAQVILEKCKAQSEIFVKSICPNCEDEDEQKRDSYLARRAEGETTHDVIFATVCQPVRNRCEHPTCVDVCKTVRLRVENSTWLIPIDLSGMQMPYFDIARLPSQLQINGALFTLGGVTLFMKGEPGHYAAVMFRDNRWLYYDGMSEPPIKVIDKLTEISGFLGTYRTATCKIAYYFRTTASFVAVPEVKGRVLRPRKRDMW